MNMKRRADLTPDRRLTYEEAVEEAGKFDGAGAHSSVSLGEKSQQTIQMKWQHIKLNPRKCCFLSPLKPSQHFVSSCLGREAEHEPTLLQVL